MKRVRWRRVLPVVAVLGVSVWAGVRGADFGPRFDEFVVTRSVRASYATGVPLPGWYNYPSMTYDLAMVAMVSAGAQCVAERALGGEGPGSALSACGTNLGTGSTDARMAVYTVHVRSLFALVSLLAVLWVYLLARRWGRGPAEALLAAAILGFSWEVVYHARWLAPDPLLMMFGALTALCLVTSRFGARPGWLFAAAVAAGLATGSKYPGGLLIVPVVLAAAWPRPIADRGSPIADPSRGARVAGPDGRGAGVEHALPGLGPTSRERSTAANQRRSAIGDPRSGAKRPLRLAGMLAGAFALTFLLTTPGAVVEPGQFIADVRFEMAHYQEGHGTYTVEPGLGHMRVAGTYLALDQLSRFDLLALVLALLAPVGAWALWRQDRRAAILFLTFPVAYLLYMSTQRVFFVRNMLVLAPFLALLSARGAAWVHGRLPPGWPRTAIAGALAAVCVANAAWVVDAADSVDEWRAADPAAIAARYIAERPEQRFVLSEAVAAAFAGSDVEPPANVVDRADAGTLAVVYNTESETRHLWPANQREHYGQPDIGPWEVDFNYYPSWHTERLIVVGADEAREVGVRLAEAR